MDHKAFLSSLGAEQRQNLTLRSNTKGLMHLAFHWGSIILFSIWVYSNALGWQVASVFLGVLIVFLFTLLHETSHKTPFKSAWINEVVGHVCGFALFLPATWFRYFHFAHHRFTQIPGKDPELDTPKPTTWVQYIIHVSGIPVWIGHAKTLIFNAMSNRFQEFVPEARQSQIKHEAILYLVGYSALLGASFWSGSFILLKVWLFPMLLGQPFLRLYLLAEHGRCPAVANMFENTRTTFTNSLVRAIAWNMPYHTEHHSYPSVPFHKLPDLHHLIQPHLLVTTEGYTAFNKAYINEVLE